MENERYTLVDVFDNNVWVPGCPVEVLQGALILDTLIGQQCIQLSLVNNTDKRILSVNVDIICFDGEGQVLPVSPVSVIYSDMPMDKGVPFGETETFYLRSGRVNSCKCIVTRVLYLDGNVWHASGKPIEVNAQPFDEIDEDLKAIFNEKLNDSVYAGASIPLRVVPGQHSDHWVCTCGRPNANDQATCIRCGMNKAWLLQNLNIQALEDTRRERIERAQREAEQERIAAIQRERAEAEATKTVQLRQENPAGSPAAAAPVAPAASVSAAAPMQPSVPAAATPQASYIQEEDPEEKQSVMKYVLIGVLGVALVGIGVLIYFFLKA